MASIININNVSKKYRNHFALNDVTISVPENSIFGLLGPNGAGKTSLIRIINQITGPDSGEILFNGIKLNPSHIEKIGYLPEERGLYKKMKVADQVMYLAQLKGLSKTDAKLRMNYWFDKFEMQAWINKKIEELSKGMQQKVQFIVTVIHQPNLLILDEPFSGFDPINAQLIKNEIAELKKTGCTVIFSTHNMASVEELCDNIALINNSKKILDGSVKNIRNEHFNNTYKISFKGNVLSFVHNLWTGAEVLEKYSDDGINTLILKLMNNFTPNQLLQSVLMSHQIISFNQVIPSINDIFIYKVNQENLILTDQNNKVINEKN